MKIQYLFICLTVAVLASSCKDKKAPVITIDGGSSMTQFLPFVAFSGTFTAPDATAFDNEDGDLTTHILVDATNVNPNKAGTYQVVYTVWDSENNTTNEILTVNIVNMADAFVGTYTVNDSIIRDSTLTVYSQNITTTLFESRIHFTNFGNYLNNNSIAGIISSETIGALIIFQPGFDYMDNNTGDYHSFLCNGIVLSKSPLKFAVNYTDYNLTQGDTGTTHHAIYTRQ